ncbi:MAG: hypothetical protein ACXWNJ_15820 [Vulcanimicrobiaceae bacterium]
MKLRYLILLCGALTVAGCGGGGGGGGTGTPPVQPTPTPKPPALAVTPSQLSLNASGATATFAASEGNYSAQFSAVTADPASCTNVATVAGTAGTPNSYTVTAGNTAGTCTIKVDDGSGQSATVTVTVTLTQGSIQ